MIEIHLKPFMHAQDMLCLITAYLRNDPRMKGKVPQKNRDELISVVESLQTHLGTPEFYMCRAGADRLLGDLRSNSDTDVITTSVEDLRRRLLDQSASMSCLSLSNTERALFESAAPLFGEAVEAKFPNMPEDISEAGKCLALGRSTAAVFHLMRAMELAVRKLGDELNIALVDEKNWQNILDEVNKAIKALDHKLPRTKALAGAASHLYAVKVAWRNEVMHPKQTYTPEQATAIFDGVRVFVSDLAALL